MGTFQLNPFILLWSLGPSIVPIEYHLEILCVTKGGLFPMGSDMGESPDFGSGPNEVVFFGK